MRITGRKKIEKRPILIHQNSSLGFEALGNKIKEINYLSLNLNVISVVFIPLSLVVPILTNRNWSFPRCFEPRYESGAKCKAFHMKISFVCI